MQVKSIYLLRDRWINPKRNPKKVQAGSEKSKLRETRNRAKIKDQRVQRHLARSD